jgi:hypothetical protein
MKKQIILTLGALTLILGACASPTPSASPDVGTPEPMPTSADAPGMVTYTDDLAGLALDYPSGWFIDTSALAHAEESTAYTVGITSWDMSNPPTPEGKQLNTFPEGETKIELGVFKEPMTLEEAVAQQREGGSEITAEEPVALSDGTPAVILDFEGFAGPGRTLIAILNGNVIYVTGYGDLANFEPIALSLRANP